MHRLLCWFGLSFAAWGVSPAFGGAGDGARPVNLAAGKSVRVVSEVAERYGQGLLDALCDGNFWTRWSAMPDDDPVLVVDLGETTRFDQVFIQWEVANAKAYRLEVSSDGSRWREVYATDDAAGGGESIVFETVEARFVKLHLLERGTSWNYSIHELEVYDNGGRPAFTDRWADYEKTLLRRVDFEDVGAGPLADLGIANLWAWSEGGEVLNVRQPSASGEMSVRGSGLGWGGGINLLVNEEIEDESFYQVVIWGKASDSAHPLRLWSNHAGGEGRWQLATSDRGAGKVRLDDTEFTRVVFTHFTGTYPSDRGVLQIEFGQEPEGEPSSGLLSGSVDTIEVYKLSPP